MKRYKHPRTPHLPYSPGISNEDRVLRGVSQFENKEIVITEKMDGENTTLYRDFVHARSTSGSMKHESQSFVKALHAKVRHKIPEGYRICVENLWAVHSIRYDKLPATVLVISAWSKGNWCLPWCDTEQLASELGLSTVPVLYMGKWDEDEVRDCFSGFSIYGGQQEGFVVRVAGGFHYGKFDKCVAKYVRKEHVQTDEHWRFKSVRRNGVCCVLHAHQ